MPWVAVAIAPAIDWRSMSPRLGIARPTPASSSFRRVQADAGLDAHPAAVEVDVEHAGHPVERQLHAVGRRRRRERVPGADRLDPPAGLVRPPHDVGDLLDRPRLGPLGGDQRWLPAQLDTVDVTAADRRQPSAGASPSGARDTRMARTDGRDDVRA